MVDYTSCALIQVAWVTNYSPANAAEDYAKDAILALSLSLNSTLCSVGEASNNNNSGSLCQTNASLEDEIQKIHFNGFSVRQVLMQLPAFNQWFLVQFGLNTTHSTK